MYPDISSATLSENDNGLVFACALDGQGGAEMRGWKDIKNWTPSGEPIWIHLHRGSPETARWLAEDSGLEPTEVRALLEEETRPRILRGKGNLVAIMRGVNLNAGADPDDMVALRMAVSQNRLITVRQRPLMTPRDVLYDLIELKGGAKTVPELFVRLTERLTERMNSVVVMLEETLDQVEQELDSKPAQGLRVQLTNVRQTAVGLRRYIGPQREALSEVLLERPKWLSPEMQTELRESSNKLQRYVEDLDAVRDRAVVVRDEMSNRQADAMNARMYALSVIAGIFLPLSFLTGLLGINVGGMPGVEYGWAFWITCALLVVILAIEFYIFRKLRWI